MQILKEHTINIKAEQATIPAPIHLPKIKDIKYDKLDIKCGCTSIQSTPNEFVVRLDKLPLVKYFVADPTTQKQFIKTVKFFIVHLDNTREEVTINITIYDPV